jgi:hypothetical protein
MATSPSGPAQKLVELLESLPAQDRKQITAWLLGLGRVPLSLGQPVTATLLTEPSRLSPRVGHTLPAGEESQLVTIRLPAERHNQLRAWCAEHGFTMASVVRGLVERFLEEQAPPGRSADRGPST